jgi:hypothetical protein
MGAAGIFQGKGRGFSLTEGSWEAIRAPRRYWVKRTAVQLRWRDRRAAAAREMESNSINRGSSHRF